MKKNYLIGLSALLLVGVMTSCGQKPTPEPTAEPTAQPTGEQTAQPSVQPTVDPSNPLAGTYDITVWVSELEGVKELTEQQIDAFEAANNCVVEYQGFTDYTTDVPTMMNTTDYGDVLMIPGTVKIEELSNFFEPLGSYDELKDKYNWIDNKMYDGVVYGIPHLGSVAGGICYNKRIWAEAGVTELPKTPEEFLAALKLIDENTDAIPYYTNYADASWTLVQWASLVNSAL